MMRKILLGIKSRAETGLVDGMAHGDHPCGTDGNSRRSGNTRAGIPGGYAVVPLAVGALLVTNVLAGARLLALSGTMRTA
jgi:hypothetical protein